MNNIILSGHMTRKPDLLYSKNGKEYCKFTLANNEGWGDQKTASFFDCIQWGKLATNTANFCDQGSHVIISGAITQNYWQDKDGNKRSGFNINVSRVDFLDKKKDNQTSNDPGFINNPWENKNQNEGKKQGIINNPWGNNKQNELNENDQDVPF